MPDQRGRFEWVVTVARIALIATLATLAVALAFTIAFIIIDLRQGTPWPDMVPLGIGLLGELMLGAWTVAIFGLIRVLVANEAAVMHNTGQMGRVETLLEDVATSSRKLIELDTLSDEAKSLLYRDREVEAMRESVHNMLVRQEYQAAEDFIRSIDARPLYSVEAAVMREELASTRKASIDEKIGLAIQRVEQIMARGDWSRAVREANRVQAAFPHSEKAAELPARIEAARANAKRDLLEAYGEAVRKNDVDGSINLLKELDRYVTPQEAAALQDSARGVFKAKLHNLGVQFAIRVTEGQWAEAVAVGETIVRDYPNSRMAHEANAKMDLLRQRAAAGTGSPTGSKTAGN